MSLKLDKYLKKSVPEELIVVKKVPIAMKCALEKMARDRGVSLNKLMNALIMAAVEDSKAK